ncbi:hypothetical protein [Pseudomonas phage Achelous]|uniref:Uncharacterized protein n=1 Tax=Pseudomonas phage Achelous TaxID=2163982 RepID=A0A2S1GMV6_9CAUD|nr:hypothetical protein HOT10_gp29 [Pseudomonas phage Achelous]AWD90706.1 hypothetical protein [Pseudomonas phage Achelous]
MSSKPKTPKETFTAERPERTVDVQPEDVTLGDGDTDTGASTGKRKLVRPAASTAGTGLAV